MMGGYEEYLYPIINYQLSIINLSNLNTKLKHTTTHAKIK